MPKMIVANSEIKSRIDSLTAKQVEVLNLLIEHKTSKEIARELNISPHTVDQRINFSKSKLHAASRGELANVYRGLKRIYDQSVCQESDMVIRAIPLDQTLRSDASDYVLKGPDGTNKGSVVEGEVDYRVVPQMFEGRYGKLTRLIATLCFAVLFVFLALGDLAIFSVVSEMLLR